MAHCQRREECLLLSVVSRSVGQHRRMPPSLPPLFPAPPPSSHQPLPCEPLWKLFTVRVGGGDPTFFHICWLLCPNPFFKKKSAQHSFTPVLLKLDDEILLFFKCWTAHSFWRRDCYVFHTLPPSSSLTRAKQWVNYLEPIQGQSVFLCVCMQERDNVKGSSTNQRNAVTIPEKMLIRSNCYVTDSGAWSNKANNTHCSSEKEGHCESLFFSVLRGAWMCFVLFFHAIAVSVMGPVGAASLFCFFSTHHA